MQEDVGRRDDQDDRRRDAGTEGRRPERPSTDVGPVIDEAAKKVLDHHLEWLEKNAKRVCRLKSPNEAANGCFVGPALYEISR